MRRPEKEAGPRELELKNMMIELAGVRTQLADLGEELVETKEQLEIYRQILRERNIPT